jgi:hypothetical protein
MLNEPVYRAQLTDAKRRRVPWYEIASAIQALQAWRSHDDRGLPWIAYAGDVSGYTPVALREMLRTYKASLELSTASGVSIETTFSRIPMYALEIISRIYKLDTVKAMDILKTYVENRLSIESLKHEYEIVKSDKSGQTSNGVVGRKASDDFEQSCYRALAKWDHPIVTEIYEQHETTTGWAPPSLIKWMSKSKRFSPSFAILEHVVGEDTHISAADCAMMHGWSEERIVQKLIYTDFMSKSFRRFWLLIPVWTSSVSIEKIIQQLEIDSIGLISVNPDDLTMKSHLSASVNTEIKRKALIERDALMRRAAEGVVAMRTEKAEIQDDEDIAAFRP